MKIKILDKIHLLVFFWFLYTLNAYCENIVFKENTSLADLKIAVQDAKLFPDPNGIGGKYAHFGTSISIDGNRAIVGSPSGTSMSAAYIFEYTNDSWVKTDVITPDFDDFYGLSVSLYENKAAIGSPYTNAVDIYELQDNSWVKTTRLTQGDESGFGGSVSVYGDRLLVGVNGEFYGTAYIYELNNGTWSLSKKLSSQNITTDFPYTSTVSLSSNFAVVGAVYENNRSGSVYIYQYQNQEWQDYTKLTASDTNSNDNFGSSIDISNNRMVIGAPGDEQNNKERGSVYIFEYDEAASLWGETTKLSVDEEAGDSVFGVSVDLDNNSLLIGSFNQVSFTGTPGSAYLFDMELGNWSLTKKLSPNDDYPGSSFGLSVSFANGHILIGRDNDNQQATSAGSIYSFETNNNILTQNQKIFAEGATFFNFAQSVSVNGNRALIGSTGDERHSNSGSAYIYEKIQGVWSLTKVLRPLTPDFPEVFGVSVSLFGDRAMVGATSSYNTTGSVYVFDLKDGEWSQTSRITTNESEYSGSFGASIDLNNNRAVIGDFSDDEFAKNSGASYIYEFVDGHWIQVKKLKASDSSIDSHFGSSVSLSGNRVLIGANDDAAGSAYIYDLIEGEWIESKKLLANEIFYDGNFGVSVSLDDDIALIGANQDFENGYYSGSAFIFELIDNDWIETSQLVADDGVAYDSFGVSVSLSNNVALIGSSGNFNSVATGSGYLFSKTDDMWKQKIKLNASDKTSGDEFGFAVSLSENNALIGSYRDDDRGDDSGSAYMYNLAPQAAEIKAEHTALWYNPEQNGHGISVYMLENNRMLAIWYVYDTEGQLLWLLGTGTHDATHASLDVITTSGAMFPPNFNENDVDLVEWGQFEFEFYDCNQALFKWQPSIAGFTSGELNVVRLNETLGLECSDLSSISNNKKNSIKMNKTEDNTIQAADSALWFNADQNGHGISVYLLDNNRIITTWYVYDDEGKPIWLLGTGEYDGKNAILDVINAEGGMFPPDFNANNVNLTNWGKFELEFSTCASGLFKWVPNESTGFSAGEMNITRLTTTQGLECN
jgi:hypothetical protein